MGMDIYFQAYGLKDKELGERQNLRCRGIYRAVNEWCERHGQKSPDNGERRSFTATQWAELSSKVRQAIVAHDLEFPDSSEEAANQLGLDWMTRIWPEGTVRVEYWFTN